MRELADEILVKQKIRKHRIPVHILYILCYRRVNQASQIRNGCDFSVRHSERTVNESKMSVQIYGGVNSRN